MIKLSEKKDRVTRHISVLRKTLKTLGGLYPAPELSIISCSGIMDTEDILDAGRLIALDESVMDIGELDKIGNMLNKWVEGFESLLKELNND